MLSREQFALRGCNKGDQKVELQHVPVCTHGTLHDMAKMVKGGLTSVWGDFPAEGLVARPAVPLVARNGSRIITKLKTKDFA